jgi:hypothetical protein
MSLYGPDGKPLGPNRNQQIDELIDSTRQAHKAYQQIGHSLDSLASAITAKSQLEDVRKKEQERYGKRSYTQQWWIFAAQAATFLATLAAFIAAAIYAGIAKQQTIIADQQRMSSDMQIGTLLHQVHVAERANDIAKESADSSETQGQTALAVGIRASRIDQRAWIGMGDAVIATNNSSQIKISVTLKNVGKTPAINIIAETSASSLPLDKPINNRDIEYKGEPAYMGALSPSVNTPITIAINFAPETGKIKALIEALKEERRVLYILARVTYSDIFGESHWLHFCMFVDKDLVSSHACGVYNEVDIKQNKASRPIVDKHHKP